MMTTGKVYFVGAGPGDVRLITVRGLDLIKSADVILYDRLVNTELLQYASSNVNLIYCGKQPDGESMTQDSINHLMVHHARKGQNVIRLKGGDPSIFGRVGEEAAYCVYHRIPFEIVPGITSGIAAPMYAGIPLTHRELSSSFAVITGHQKNTAGKHNDINWAYLAHSVDTLVFYMGVRSIETIQQNLLKHGKDPETPTALIRWGTCSGQETLVSDLGSIVHRVKEKNFQSPAIIVIGYVVSLHEKLAWFSDEQKHDYSTCESLITQVMMR